MDPLDAVKTAAMDAARSELARRYTADVNLFTDVIRNSDNWQYNAPEYTYTLTDVSYASFMLSDEHIENIVFQTLHRPICSMDRFLSDDLDAHGVRKHQFIIRFTEKD